MQPLNITIPASFTGSCKPIHLSAKTGFWRPLRVLASFNADIQAVESINEWTPIRTSIFYGRFQATKTLILLGAPVTSADLRQDENSRESADELWTKIGCW